MFWKVRAMPLPRAMCGWVLVISTPSKEMVPAVTGNTPQTRLTVVLLPEPLGPMRPKI